MKLKSAKDVSSLLEVLRVFHPLSRKLRVRIVRMKAHGSCGMSDDENLITIHIKEQDPASVRVDNLIHEYAHAVKLDITGYHSELWGEIHSKIYTTWVRNFA